MEEKWFSDAENNESDIVANTHDLRAVLESLFNNDILEKTIFTRDKHANFLFEKT